jgi:peptide/nickel transport system substrate-binding protein
MIRSSTRGATRRLLAPALLAGFVVASCGGPAPTATPVASSPPSSGAASAAPVSPSAAARGRDGTLTLFYWQAPTILNPHLSPGSKDLSASRLTYEPLASYDKDGNLIPFLAAEIPSLENGGVAADGKSVTWKLKPDVKWSDGQPFSADDVRFTWQYATDPAVAATSSAAYGGVTDVVVVDPLTVRIEFAESNPGWATPFVGVNGMILPKHVFEPYKGKNAADAPPNDMPVGTGPFKVVEFSTEDVLVVGGDAVPTKKIVYEANPYYRDPSKPAFAKVILQGGGGDATVGVKAIADGTADYAWNLQVDDATAAQVESGGKGKIVGVLGAFVERIMLNFSDPNKQTADGERSSVTNPHQFLNDAAVRQAIAHAVDRTSIAALYGKGGAATGDILGSPSNVASGNVPPAYDLDEAKRLLDAAGWKDSNVDGIRDKGGVPLRLVFQTSINPVRQQAQDIVKKSLDSIGFDVQLKNIDSSVFFGPVEGTTNTRRQFYADLEEFAYSNKSPDPTAYMKAWTCDEAAQKANDWSKSNWSRYCNPAYDALWKQAALELDPDKRATLFKQMNDFLIDDGAVIPLAHLADQSGASSTLQGLDLTPWDLEPWNIADWTRGG